MADLSVTIIQTQLYWESKEENLNMFSSKIATIKNNTDLIVLPEMFSTGFSMDPHAFAESMTGNTVEWMRKKAFEKNCVITGSFIAEENGNYYNRLVWMSPDGNHRYYDKRHLFRMGAENNHYHSGRTKELIELKGWKILPLVCYDLRFPVWSRNDMEAPYDLLIYVANWPERRAQAWKTLLLARAIENQAYVVGVNRVGEDGHGLSHSGDSAAINPMGEIISTTLQNEENIETILLRKEALSALRKNFPVLLDADRFNIL